MPLLSTNTFCVPKSLMVSDARVTVAVPPEVVPPAVVAGAGALVGGACVVPDDPFELLLLLPHAASASAANAPMATVRMSEVRIVPPVRSDVSHTTTDRDRPRFDEPGVRLAR